MWIPFIDDKNTPWEVNQIGLWMLVRQYLHAKLMFENSRISVEHNLLSADLLSVDIDFAAVRIQKEQQAPLIYDELTRASLQDGRNTLNSLIELRKRTEQFDNKLKARQQHASSRTMANIETSIDRWNFGLEAARTIRDLSVTTLTVGATFLSGGTAAAVLGAGSALKGISTYQDTANVGSALIDATGTFVVSLIPLAKGGAASLTRLGQTVGQRAASTAAVRQAVNEGGAILLIGTGLNSGFTLAKSMAEGKTVSHAVHAAAVTAGVGLAKSVTGPWLDSKAFRLGTRLVTDAAVDTTANIVTNAAGPQQQITRLPENKRFLADLAPGTPTATDFVNKNVMRPGY